MKEYTTRKAGELLHIKVRTVRGWIRSGKLKARKDKKRNRLFISQKEINRITSGEDNAD